MRIEQTHMTSWGDWCAGNCWISIVGYAYFDETVEVVKDFRVAQYGCTPVCVDSPFQLCLGFNGEFSLSVVRN
jgi:hypothetical protein